MFCKFLDELMSHVKLHNGIALFFNLVVIDDKKSRKSFEILVLSFEHFSPLISKDWKQSFLFTLDGYMFFKVFQNLSGCKELSFSSFLLYDDLDLRNVVCICFTIFS